MSRIIYTALAAAGLLALAGCAQNGAPPDTTADVKAMHDATDAWVAAYNAGDADKIVAMYDEEAIMMPPDSTSLKGHAAMKEYLAANIAASKSAGLGFALDSDAGSVTGDSGWHSGTFHVTDAKGATAGTGKYVEVWHKTDGKWLMLRDIWNNDPAATPAPAAAPAVAPAPPAKKK
jgi:ketosteroid isomerase-like protein